MPKADKTDITLGLLAGGEGRRFGGRDKGLAVYHGENFAAVTLAALAAQLGHNRKILISANRNTAIYQQYASVVPDLRAGFNGPLAGVEALLAVVKTDYLLCAPCDLIKPPAGYVAALCFAIEQPGIKAAYLHDGKRDHYTCLIIHRSLNESLRAYLDSGRRSVKGWLASVDTAVANVTEEVFNINSPQNLDSANNGR